MLARALLVSLLVLAGVVGRADAAPLYPAIYAFGDSLSDAGNVYIATGGAEPVSPPYSHGRFSNGRVWVQDLARAIGFRRLAPSLLGGSDFAYGGAQSGPTLVHALASNDLPSQFAQFAAEVRHPRSGALYTLWIGANDLFSILADPGLTQDQVAQVEAQAVGNEATFVSGIAALGARNLLLVTVSDLGKVPAVTSQGAAASAAATALSAGFNQQLVATMQVVTRWYGIHLRIVDSFALLDDAIADPAADGFSNVTAPCWSGSPSSLQGTLCSYSVAVQNTYLFWDAIHPTARGHALFAAAAEAALGVAAERQAVRLGSD